MVYCNHCACEVDVEVDDANGFSCCVQCGHVLEDTAFSADVTFQKDAGGESAVVGQFVNESGVARGIGRIHGGRVYAYQADSHEKALQRGRHEIAHLVDMLSVRPREESIEGAHRLYKMGLQRGFTRGRRTNQVAAACLYLFCRMDSKPFLLIDFSDALQVNVFALGAVFLQLAKLVRMTEHPSFAKPVDPSLYIHRFADRLDFGRQMHAVANTALRLVASMKRDWIQTGRRPSGICGAAIYIAAHIHGFERSIRDVVSVVHIGQHTLSKRLYEFSSTTASDFTAEEFEEQAKAIDASETARLEAVQPEAQPAGLLEGAGCEHLRMGEAHFAHAMCRACYLDFMQSSGGVFNGANPPAYERNRRKEVAELLALPGPEDDEGEGDEVAGEDEEYDQEEQGIAEAMVSAFHESELQQFAKFLPSTAEEAAVAEEGGARATRRRRRADQDTAAEVEEAAGGERKRRSPEEGAGVAEGGEQGGEQEQREQQPAGGAAQSADGPSSEEVAAQQADAKQQQLQEKQQQQQEEEEEQVHAEKRQRSEGAQHSQLSDQTGAPAAAQDEAAVPAGVADAAGAGGSSRHLSQHSDQTAAVAAAGEPAEPAAPAAEAAAAAEEEEEEEEGDEAAVGPGAIVPVPQPPAGQGGDEGREGGGGDTLSDIDDADIDMYLADEAEVKCKEEIWNMMNRDWLEKQAAKRAAQEAAERLVAEQQAAQEAAEAAGVAFKRGRGRPLGSKTKNHRAAALADLPPAESAQEAAMRMLDYRKLSSKINYSALADLFADDGGAGSGGAGEPPALVAEALEGDEDDRGRGKAVSAAMREREEQQKEEARQLEARQLAALEAERRSIDRRSSKARAGAARLDSLGLSLAGAAACTLGGGGSGPLSPKSGVGSLGRRAGGLGSLRDSNFRSAITSKADSAAAGGSKKSVRFAD